MTSAGQLVCQVCHQRALTGTRVTSNKACRASDDSVTSIKLVDPGMSSRNGFFHFLRNLDFEDVGVDLNLGLTERKERSHVSLFLVTGGLYWKTYLTSL